MPRFEDNSHQIDGKEAVGLIKAFFQSNLPVFTLLKETHESFGYWDIKYAGEEAVVFISNFRGGFDNLSITIAQEEYPLWQINKQIGEIGWPTEKSIQLILNTIKTFFDRPHPDV